MYLQFGIASPGTTCLKVFTPLVVIVFHFWKLLLLQCQYKRVFVSTVAARTKQIKINFADFPYSFAPGSPYCLLCLACGGNNVFKSLILNVYEIDLIWTMMNRLPTFLRIFILWGEIYKNSICVSSIKIIELDDTNLNFFFNFCGGDFKQTILIHSSFITN